MWQFKFIKKKKNIYQFSFSRQNWFHVIHKRNYLLTLWVKFLCSLQEASPAKLSTEFYIDITEAWKKSYPEISY